MTSDSAKPPRKKHEPVDDRLLGTAGRCFIEDGFGFGIDDILAQSNVAKMSLYVKFQSKYGLIERLLEMARVEWLTEIEKVAANGSLQGADKIVRLVKVICAASREFDRRTGLIGQALVEFPRTGKDDETHKKKDLVHEKARQLQLELLKAVERLCADAGVEGSPLVAQQVLLLINGYLVMEPLLGKGRALSLIAVTTHALIRSAPKSKGAEPARPQRPLSEPKKSGKVTKQRLAEIKKAHPNANEPWTREAEIRLAERSGSGASVPDLAKEFDRSTGSIKSRLRRLVRESAIDS